MRRRAKSPEPRDPEFAKYGIYEQSAPRPAAIAPVATSLPLELKPGDHIAFIGNTLFERAQLFGHIEALLHQRFPKHQLVVRNLSWSADEIDLAPRPANFADIEQHLTHEKIDVILAAYGFNESFAGDAGLEAFRGKLAEFVAGAEIARPTTASPPPRIVLISPIANENIAGVAAADLNNARIQKYAAVMREVAREQQVGFVDVFAADAGGAAQSGLGADRQRLPSDRRRIRRFCQRALQGTVRRRAPEINEALRQAIIDKNRQFFRRYRPLNTFYYTGGRNEAYGYLDFLPAMRNFDLMVANRDQRIWDLAQGKTVPPQIDDSNVPPLPKTDQSRGANEWLPAAEELKAFQGRSAVRGEPVRGRGAVSRDRQSDSDALRHARPAVGELLEHLSARLSGQRAARQARHPRRHRRRRPGRQIDDLRRRPAHAAVVRARRRRRLCLGHAEPDVSEGHRRRRQADVQKVLLSGFGTEDSHHALHDFIWTPDGDLLFRESIFHHSQVETPYGPVRQQNSGWFRFEPRTHRLTSFGTYPSTNPWGVTFDDWGKHVASHPIFAAAFHALDPPYPQQHPAPAGLRAYSGTCGHEFVDFAAFPGELQGHFIKVRYKPTNRVEIHKWIEGEFGYDEEYVSDLIFSTNLSFIPVDLKFGPRGDLYVCDWYNPVKGHAQYSLRDERRDRHSGRIRNDAGARHICLEYKWTGSGGTQKGSQAFSLIFKGKGDATLASFPFPLDRSHCYGGGNYEQKTSINFDPRQIENV